MNTKQIDANKLSDDLSTFQRIYDGETYYRTDFEYLELPKIARKSVPSLCLNDRAASICRRTARHNYWCNAALTFRITDQDSDLIPNKGGDSRYKNLIGPIQEADISAKEYSVVVVAQNANRVMFESSNAGRTIGRIVIQKKYLQAIKRFSIEQIESFSTDRDFSCLRVVGVSGEMVGLIMGMNSSKDPSWSKTVVADRKEKLLDAFNMSESVSVIFDKQITDNGTKIVRIRFDANDGLSTVFTAEKRIAAYKWSLRKTGVHDIVFDDLRELKKFARAMAGCMTVGKNGFVEFSRKVCKWKSVANFGTATRYLPCRNGLGR